MTLMKELLDELERNIELRKAYQEIGGPAVIGASMIKVDIEEVKKHISEDNLPEMLKVFEKLKKNK